MSAFIGNVHVPGVSVDVWCSSAGAEITVTRNTPRIDDDILTLDPINARNLAALLVRASEETERMRNAKRL